MNNRVIYISYDGLTDPLGESQILSYIVKNVETRDFSIYSYEKPGNKNFDRINQICSKNKINWRPLTYTKKPPILSTIKDLIVGYRQIVKKESLHTCVCHARSYMGGIIALNLKRRKKVPFIFDMRGWMIDENIESGRWAHFVFGFVIKYMRKIEKKLIDGSDRIVSLTYCAKDVLVKKYGVKEEKISVIPTCVNFDYFYFDEKERARIRENLGISDDAYVLVYSGTVGGYYNIEEMLEIFYSIKQKKANAVFLFVTKSNPDIVLCKVKDGFKDCIRVEECCLNEMYKYLSASDAGLILYNNSFSSTGRSPTKLAEYWAVGLPVICPKGVGDLDLFFQDGIGGVQFNLNDKTSYLDAVEKLFSINFRRELILAKAKENFDSVHGAQMYREIYKELDR